MNNRSVCMFVWNTFTNDARVLRECTALAESGYEVDLIAIHDPKAKQSKKSEKKNGFNITRVDRYPKLLLLLKEYKGVIKKRKYLYYPTVLVLFLVAIILLIKYTLFSCILGSFILLLKYIRFPRLWVNGNIIYKMIRAGMRKNYTIYHSNDLNTLPQGWICAKVLSFKKKKLVYDSHEVQTSRTGYGKNVYYIEKFFIKRIDAFINTNKTRAEYTSNLYKIELPHIVHNYPFYLHEGAKSKEVNLHHVLRIAPEEPILLYQGGIQLGRGLEKIIEAAPNFKKGIVVFLGDGRIKPELEKMVSDRKLNNKVKFLPKVPVEELPGYTANAYLGFQVLNNICFNHYSACSNKLYEYIMVNVPVVACDFPEIKRVVEGEKVGITIDSHNPEEIAKAVNYMLDNKIERDKMSENCKNAKEIYNWNLEKFKLIEIYNNLLGVNKNEKATR